MLIHNSLLRLRLESAYRIVGGSKPSELPREISLYGVKRTDRDSRSTPAETAGEIAEYFAIPIKQEEN